VFQASRVLPTGQQRSLAARLCRAGDQVQLRAYANADHLGIIDAAGGDVLACWATGWPADPPALPANPEGAAGGRDAATATGRWPLQSHPWPTKRKELR
jgi:hypothetical protein